MVGDARWHDHRSGEVEIHPRHGGHVDAAANEASRVDLSAVGKPRIMAIAGGLNARLYMIDTSNNVFAWEDVQNPD